MEITTEDDRRVLKAAIQALAEKLVPDSVTEKDINDALAGARRAYRQDLSHHIRQELLKDGALDFAQMIKDALESILEDARKEIASKITHSTYIGANIREVIEKMVKEEFNKGGLPAMKNIINEEVREYAKRFVEENVLVKIKDGGTW